MTTTVDIKYSPKRPQDIEFFGTDIRRLVPAGDTISNVSVEVALRKGRGSTANMKVGVPIYSGTKVQHLIGAGTDQATYDIRFLIDTVAGLHLEVVGELFVRE